MIDSAMLNSILDKHGVVNMGPSTAEFFLAIAQTVWREAQQEEREACAQICDARAEKIEQAANDAALNGEREEISSLRATAWQLSVCAAAIRARGEIK